MRGGFLVSWADEIATPSHPAGAQHPLLSSSMDLLVGLPDRWVQVQVQIAGPGSSPTVESGSRVPATGRGGGSLRLERTRHVFSSIIHLHEPWQSIEGLRPQTSSPANTTQHHLASFILSPLVAGHTNTAPAHVLGARRGAVGETGNIHFPARAPTGLRFAAPPRAPEGLSTSPPQVQVQVQVQVTDGAAAGTRPSRHGPVVGRGLPVGSPAAWGIGSRGETRPRRAGRFSATATAAATATATGRSHVSRWSARRTWLVRVDSSRVRGDPAGGPAVVDRASSGRMAQILQRGLPPILRTGVHLHTCGAGADRSGCTTSQGGLDPGETEILRRDMSDRIRIPSPAPSPRTRALGDQGARGQGGKGAKDEPNRRVAERRSPIARQYMPPRLPRTPLGTESAARAGGEPPIPLPPRPTGRRSSAFGGSSQVRRLGASVILLDRRRGRGPIPALPALSPRKSGSPLSILDSTREVSGSASSADRSTSRPGYPADPNLRPPRRSTGHRLCPPPWERSRRPKPNQTKLPRESRRGSTHQGAVWSRLPHNVYPFILPALPDLGTGASAKKLPLPAVVCHDSEDPAPSHRPLPPHAQRQVQTCLGWARRYTRFGKRKAAVQRRSGGATSTILVIGSADSLQRSEPRTPSTCGTPSRRSPKVPVSRKYDSMIPRSPPPAAAADHQACQARFTRPLPFALRLDSRSGRRATSRHGPRAASREHRATRQKHVRRPLSRFCLHVLAATCFAASAGDRWYEHAIRLVCMQPRPIP
ncbi:hypothetical protein JHW43_005927 [Diplocarpon mali]|nr:hypothetical protein JHW43_005927 [Diplocarpon mali]